MSSEQVNKRSTQVLGSESVIVWDESQDAVMTEYIKTKMDAGYTFFIVEHTGCWRPLSDAASAAISRKIIMDRSFMNEAVASGAVSVAVASDVNPGSLRRAATACEAAAAETLAIKPVQGG